MCDNYEYLKDKIDSYSAYLDNVRGQAISVNSLKTEFHSIDITLTEKKIRKPDAQKVLDVSWVLNLRHQPGPWTVSLQADEA